MILVVGVNGTGKTTTIGKIAWHLQKELGRVGAARRRRHLPRRGRRAARDAGRSAPAARSCAATRAPTPARSSSTPSTRPRRAAPTWSSCDTAGRLHTQQHLMDELRKVRRVIAEPAPGRAARDAARRSTPPPGQNGLRQALLFREAVEVTGIVLTKLDGTAKGGIALAIAQELGLPVKLIGIGEALEDLRPFDPDDFARAILGAMQRASGDGTRVVRAGLPEPEQGEPFLPGPVFAAPFHLSRRPGGPPTAYTRYGNPTWARYEEAVGSLEERRGRAVRLGHGRGHRAAPDAASARLGGGHRRRLLPRRPPLRRRRTWSGAGWRCGWRRPRELAAGGERCDLLWLEIAVQPGKLEVYDIAALAEARRADGALAVVDNTTAGPAASAAARPRRRLRAHERHEADERATPTCCSAT